MYQLIVIMLGSLFRMLLLAAFGALVERGVWNQDQIGQIAAGLAGLVVVGGYALWNHYKNRIKFLTALEMPPGTTEAHINEKLSATDATKQAVAGLGLFTGAMNKDGADSDYVYAKRLFTEGLKNKKLAVNCAIDEAITTLKSETSG